MNLFGPYIQRPGSSLDLLVQWQPRVVTLMDVSGDFIRRVRDRCLNTIIVYRKYEDGADFRRWKPKDWVNRLLADVRGCLPDYIVTLNEPFGHDAHDLFQPFDVWQAEVIKLLQEAGADSLANCFGTGNFTAALNRMKISEVFPLTCQIANAMGPHDYSWPTLEAGWSWYAGRWFQWYEDILTTFSKKMKFIVGECGLTQAIIVGRPDVGWRSGGPEGVTDQSYLDSLRWYHSRVAEWNKDKDVVLGLCLYLFHGLGWQTFEHADKSDVINTIMAMDVASPVKPNGGNEMNLEGIRVFKFMEPNQQIEVFGQEAEDLVFKKYAMEFRRASVEAGKKVYRLVELREKRGSTALITKVIDGAGDPRANIDVAFYWPYAPKPPDPPTTVYSTDWYPNFVHGITNANGDVGPGMGKGAYYRAYPGPGDPRGPHAVWVRDPNVPSDICEKLGMLAGTFHDHLDQEFQRVVEGEAPPEPEPEPEPPPLTGWAITVEKVSAMGLRLLVLVFPHTGIGVQVQSPWGRIESIVSGTKPEYGPGGCELRIWADGLYTIRFLEQTFTVQMDNNICVKARFVEAGPELKNRRLISGAMTVSMATQVLENLDAKGFAGVFSVEEV